MDVPIEPHKLKVHVPILDGVKLYYSQVSVDMMTEQISVFSQLFSKKEKNVLAQLFILLVSVMLRIQRVLKIFYSQNLSHGI